GAPHSRRGDRGAGAATLPRREQLAARHVLRDHGGRRSGRVVHLPRLLLPRHVLARTQRQGRARGRRAAARGLHGRGRRRLRHDVAQSPTAGGPDRRAGPATTRTKRTPCAHIHSLPDPARYRCTVSDRTPPYAETILDFHTQPPFTIDLRQPIAPRAITRLGDAGLGEPFAVITACNPAGKLLDAEENARQTARFEALLRRIGIAFTRVDGCSPDRTHREPGFAVRLPL